MKLCMLETTEICSRIYTNKGFYWYLSTEAMSVSLRLGFCHRELSVLIGWQVSLHFWVMSKQYWTSYLNLLCLWHVKKENKCCGLTTSQSMVWWYLLTINRQLRPGDCTQLSRSPVLWHSIPLQLWARPTGESWM